MNQTREERAYFTWNQTCGERPYFTWEPNMRREHKLFLGTKHSEREHTLPRNQTRRERAYFTQEPNTWRENKFYLGTRDHTLLGNQTLRERPYYTCEPNWNIPLSKDSLALLKSLILESNAFSAKLSCTNALPLFRNWSSW